MCLHESDQPIYLVFTRAQAVQDALEANPGEIALASFSHITSIPAMILPVKEVIIVVALLCAMVAV